MELYTKAQLVRKSNVPHSTLYGRLDEFNDFFSPVRNGNQLYYTKYDYYRLMLIHGMRTTKPINSTSKIRKTLKELNHDLIKLELLEQLSKILK
ncbi:MerR family transcriptional regulator [Priestia megaterium]|uniref:MerR family transcriptional regulator n=1 Tax=Priestia megaterium TaxID=1404 RepID=UPI003008B072